MLMFLLFVLTYETTLAIHLTHIIDMTSIFEDDDVQITGASHVAMMLLLYN